MNRANLNPWNLYYYELRRARNNRAITHSDYCETMLELSDEFIFDMSENAKGIIRDYFDDGEPYVIACELLELREDFINKKIGLVDAMNVCYELATSTPVNEWDVFAMFCDTFKK